MIKNKALFYLLSFTWGLPMTLIGCIAAVFLLVIRYRPYKYGYCYCFEVGEGWGGVNLGVVIVISKNSSEHTKAHEVGHSLQNCWFGFLMPFIVGIPSAIRYWYREWLVGSGRKKYSELPEYDSAWYEGSASKFGHKFMNWYMQNN
jgi:hypothetical protein